VGFQTPQYKLSKLLEQAGSGSIQLPDFQRGYKWDEERIRSLLVTVTLGHPLGVLMLLQTGNDQVRFKPKAIQGTPPEAGKAGPGLLLLDGQQRLTSLYQSLTGSGVVDTEDTRKKQVQRRFYINIERALQDRADQLRQGHPARRIVAGEGTGTWLLPVPADLRSDRFARLAVEVPLGDW
jgi:uncharacterized protein with ParB-like and HNH nuclease domain